MSSNSITEASFFRRLCAGGADVYPANMCLVTILPPVLILTRRTSVDPQTSTTIFSTDKLPLNGSSIDYRLMAYVGNGHVATVIFSDFIYMNGLYNGVNGTSHRARIPSIHNWQFKLESLSSSLYSLDVASGENSFVKVEQSKSCTHVQCLRRHVIIGHAIVVPVEVNEQTTSIDFDLQILSRDDKHVLLLGTTREVENNLFQNDRLSLFMYYTPLPTDGFQLGAQETSRTYLFVTSLDTEQVRAKRSFDYASNEREPDEIWSSHASLWNQVWLNGRIDIRDDVELQRQVNSALYYILSSLPPLSTRSEHKQFYGLSPGSLSRGGRLGEDYGGHSFWDTETWMYPSILLFYPTLAKEILSYRIALRDAATYNADLFGYEGWRYPWESARTGIDVTPDCCPEVRLYQMHITGDIAFSARQYIAATRDQSWLKTEMGGDLIYETARFWASRAIYNSDRNQYEILMVLPPDEDAQPFKNNSVFTNAVASLSIQLANQVGCITEKLVPQLWLDIANNLYFPFDNVTQIHLEYENFNPKNATIKQADVVLLGFPLMWPMSKEVRRNDLLTYERLTRDDGPAMTWSMHAIGHLELNDFELAEELFRRSYETYVRPPFNVWTEARSGVGAVNFITGAGGFLQAVLFGYGGLRLTLNELEIMPPSRLPNRSTQLVFHGLKYNGATLDLTIEKEMYHVSVRALNNDNSKSILYEHEQQRGSLRVNDILSFPVDTRLIIYLATPLCL
ncbi:unnamed protein product [Rotaria sp. Silwood2]|nr:unnamed protein product [Rotaria sp. Silwood2]CAF4286603.1 unnamed protein product [Rotaria sp. Silwood2]CAF4306989.1 unnamed protein product [Rotaria sp. Silwood2]